jgi:hypothetical protein
MVTVGGVLAELQLANDSTIFAIAPEGEGSQKPIIVTSNGASSTPAAFGYQPPVIEPLEVAGGIPAVGGTTITLRGQNFGRSPAVLVNGLSVPTNNASHTEVTVDAMPPATRPVYAVQVLAANQFSPIIQLPVSAPSIASVTPVSFPTAGGQRITITGANFVPSHTQVISPDSGTLQLAEPQSDSSSIVVLSPQGEGFSSLSVVVGGRSSTSIPFDFIAPSISDIFPRYLPASGGTIITIHGENFGINPVVNFNYTGADAESNPQVFSLAAASPEQPADHERIIVRAPAFERHPEDSASGMVADAQLQVNAASRLSQPAPAFFRAPASASVASSEQVFSGEPFALEVVTEIDNPQLAARFDGDAQAPVAIGDYSTVINVYNDGFAAVITQSVSISKKGYDHYVAQASNAAQAQLSDPDADPFGVGVTNRMAFAFGFYPDTVQSLRLDPSIPQGMPELQVDPDTGSLYLVFARRTAASGPGIHYSVEVQDHSMNEWQPLSADSFAVQPVDATWELVRAPLALPEGEGRILGRVRVEAVNE